MKVPDDVAELISKIHQRKVVLFVGNGASVAAGGPKTADLVTLIKKTFPKAQYKNDDFIQTCTDVTETTLTNRVQLEDVVKKALRDLKPGTFHLELPLHTWPAIFTTNYDDLIERGYQATAGRVQTLDPVFSDRDLITLNDTEKVKLFKLMGCIISQHPDNKLVLTRSDYNRALRSHPDIFRTLTDIMKDGTILYAGYSFQDNVLLDLLDDIRSAMKNPLPYSYALFPDLDPASVQAVKLHERNIVPLQRTAQEITHILGTGIQPKLVPVADKPGVTVYIRGQQKVIPHQNARMYLQSFDFLHEEKLHEIGPDDLETRRAFFKGELTNWTGFLRNWDFVRVEYDKIAERTQAELADLDMTKNKAILLFGPAGSGKSWMLRRLALDAYKIWGSPVVVLRPYYEDIDLKLLASLCEELSYMERKVKGKVAAVRARVLIIMENASSHVMDFRTFATMMKSRGIPVLIFGSARENEWELACQNLSSPASYADSYSLSDEFESPEERAQFLHHLTNLGFIQGQEEGLEGVIETEYRNSFFGSVYSLIEPARPLLDDKIEEEYNNLPALPQQAYLLVCSFFQFGLPMPLALVVRALQCSYTQFIEQIFETEAKRIICNVEAPLEGAYLGSRLRIIAEKVIEKKLPDLNAQVAILKQILSNINPRNVDEAQICRTLLIRHLGPNGTDRRFSAEQTRELFRAALDIGRLEDASLLHHYGLFESDHDPDKQDVALAIVSRALKLAERRQPAVFVPGGERVENIFNTMGLIHMRKAEAAEQAGNAPLAEQLYSSASDYFQKAKAGELQTPHPYHCESRMYYYKATRAAEPAQKVLHLSKALDVISDAEDNLAEDSLPKLLEMRSQVCDALSQITNLNDVITQIEHTAGHEVDGALARTKLILMDSASGQEDLERALAILKKSVTQNATNPQLLRTYYKLLKRTHPDEIDTLFSILKMRYAIPVERRNASLLYDMGVMFFTFDEYLKSAECFRLLERISQGHPRRWGIHDRGTDRSRKIKEFQGTVVRKESRSVGYVDITSLRRTVPFIPYAQSFDPQVGDNVSVQIAFNYRGWLAVDLIK